MRLRMGGNPVNALILILVFLILGGVAFDRALSSIAWFVETLAPYIAGAVGLFLVVVIVLRRLNR